MKTSNKILLFIGLALLVSPFINAYSLRQKLINKEYTLLKDRNKSDMESIPFLPTDSVHIIGGYNLSVKIIQSDTAFIEKHKDTDVYIDEKNGVLTIQYSREDNPEFSEPKPVIIKTPFVKVISIQGKLIVNKNVNTITRFYSPFEVTIQDFKTERMNITGLNGSGMINLDNNQIKNLSLAIGEGVNFRLDGKSHIDSMKIKAAEKSSIAFIGTHVNFLSTELDSTAAITIVGNNVAHYTR